MCRALRPAPYIFAGLCSLFHCYLVAATAAFLDVPLASLVADAVPQVHPAHARALQKV